MAIKNKYKFVCILLFIIATGAAQGQQIQNIEYSVIEPEFFFPCGKITSIDLFKAAKFYASPQNGYWGDKNGNPYNGKSRGTADEDEERQYTNNNIFSPPDTGMYDFYFYFTSEKSYCGLSNNSRLNLKLYVGLSECIKKVEVLGGKFFDTYQFCYGSSISMPLNNQLGKLDLGAPETVTIDNILSSYFADSLDWQAVTVEVYRDKNYTQLREDSHVNLSPSTSPDGVGGTVDSMFYFKIHVDETTIIKDSIRIRVFPKSTLKLDILYDGSSILDESFDREYGLDDKITIKVDTSGNENVFADYVFYLNNKNLNNYYLIDEKSNNITLSALSFSGLSDFVETVVTDQHGCIVRNKQDVIVRVGFPTVFTPDGDGVNDIFFGSEKYRNREFHLEVINRWGSRLYYGTTGWDGTYNGGDVPPGTYLYVLILKLADGSTKTITGTVTLMRNN
ncbi:MAG: gliding motility-associated C-terminal domain-containing protein [Prevotellaceae bacterium]|jgi:gliding motility-associated-like protein|nr:gliding motility-associated C-terminal domain-containing protein [Prevotellaceae bacterium]